MENNVRKVASMTKARCLLTDAKGTEDFGEIIRIFQFIYDKFFDFYNEDHDANLSYRIIILLKDNFPIIAKKKSGFEKNFETIKDIVSREGEKTEINTPVNWLILPKSIKMQKRLLKRFCLK